MRVAFPGEHGAFSEEAAVRFGGYASITVPCRTFDAVVRLVSECQADVGVIPVDNKIVGAIGAALDALRRTPGVEIITSTELPVRLHLLGVPGASAGAVRRVASHPVALAQCGNFLKTLRRAHPVEWYDTAGAARDAAQAEDRTFAAIASAAAARLYGLATLASDVHDRPDNATRFVAIRRRA